MTLARNFNINLVGGREEGREEGREGGREEGGVQSGRERKKVELNSREINSPT